RPVPRADTFHAAFPLRHHVRVDRSTSLAVSPGEVGQLLRQLLLRPPRLGAQLPEPWAPTLDRHVVGTPFTMDRASGWRGRSHSGLSSVTVCLEGYGWDRGRTRKRIPGVTQAARGRWVDARTG